MSSSGRLASIVGGDLLSTYSCSNRAVIPSAGARSLHVTVCYALLARAVPTASHGVLLELLNVGNQRLFLLKQASLIVPVNRRASKCICPFHMVALLDIWAALVLRSRSSFLVGVVPVFEAMTIVDVIVEPFKSLDLLCLLSQHFSLVVQLSQLFVLEYLQLLF